MDATVLTTTRISARATLAGVLVTLALYVFLQSLGGAFGLWSLGVLDADAAEGLGAGFAVWSAAAWVAAVFLGAMVAVLARANASPRGALIQGLVTWAGSCVTACVVGCMWFMSAVDVGLVRLDALDSIDGSALLWTFFAASALAIVAALAGGRFGARVEVPGPPVGEVAARPLRTEPA